jgi:hypothetical protein
MNTPQTKTALSPARRRLLDLMQEVNFGSIERLRVRGGDPVFDPPPKVMRDVKLGTEPAPSPTGPGEGELKTQVRDLFKHMDAMGNGTVRRIEIQHGIPFRLRMKKKVRA